MRKKLVECRALDEEGRLAVLYDLYAARLEDYEAATLDESWDGVYVAKTT